MGGACAKPAPAENNRVETLSSGDAKSDDQARQQGSADATAKPEGGAQKPAASSTPTANPLVPPQATTNKNSSPSAQKEKGDAKRTHHAQQAGLDLNNEAGGNQELTVVSSKPLPPASNEHEKDSGKIVLPEENGKTNADTTTGGGSDNSKDEPAAASVEKDIAVSDADGEEVPSPSSGNEKGDGAVAGDVLLPDGRKRTRRVLTLSDGSVYEGDVIEGVAMVDDAEEKDSEGKAIKKAQQTLELTGKGVLTYISGDVYAGDFENGKRHGEGFFRNKDSTVTYNGQYRDNKRHGRGELVNDSCRYVGLFEEDEMHDPQGIYTFEDKSVYTGPLVKGEMTGYAVLTNPDGTGYQGLFVDGVRHGKGVEYFEDGAKMSGEFVDGVLVGKGIYTFENGETYEGDFEDGVFHGEGVMTRNDGARYEGTFENGQMSGKGRYVFASGDVYEGEMKDNNLNGKGVLNRKLPQMEKPIVYTGTFVNGLLEGEGTCVYPTGDEYTGHFVRQQFDGRGVLRRADGSVYDGDFSEGVMKGRGTYTFPNGQGTYEGEMEKGHFNGKGSLVQRRTIGDPPRTIEQTFTGNWVDGKQQGSFEVRSVFLDSGDTKVETRMFEAGELVPSA